MVVVVIADGLGVVHLEVRGEEKVWVGGEALGVE
jgi:hypothetical protein